MENQPPQPLPEQLTDLLAKPADARFNLREWFDSNKSNIFENTKLTDVGVTVLHVLATTLVSERQNRTHMCVWLWPSGSIENNKHLDGDVYKWLEDHFLNGLDNHPPCAENNDTLLLKLLKVTLHHLSHRATEAPPPNDTKVRCLDSIGKKPKKKAKTMNK